MSNKKKSGIIIYKTAKNGADLVVHIEKETIWLTQNQIASLFGTQRPAITKHLSNIFKTGELKQGSVSSILEHTASDGKTYKTKFYNLDAILSVGYRVNSKKATIFRQWATKVLRQHVLDGYTINKKRLAKNYEAFLRAVEGVKKFLPVNGQIRAGDALELVKIFAATWFSLDAYDNNSLPQKGATKKQVKITVANIIEALAGLKKELAARKEAGELFGIEKTNGSISGIIGNVFQSFGKKDLYPTVEEKAAHLFYFIIKSHPFIDGNKRSGAFAFVWFLKSNGILDASKLTPEALTALTLLVAESDPKDKSQIIGLVLMLLKG